MHTLSIPVSNVQKQAIVPPKNNKRTAAQKNIIEKEQKVEEIKNENSSTIVSREMKLEFCQKVKNLSNNGLLMLVDKIKEVKAQSMQILEEDKI